MTLSRSLVALLLLTACRDVDRQDERRALAAVSARVPDAGELRVFRRSGLSTAAHRVLRVTGEGLDLTLVVDEASVRFAGDPETLAHLLRTEEAHARLGELGAERIAAWIGSLGDGTCGPPREGEPVARTGASLRFRFAGATGWRECTVELAADGTPIAIHSIAVATPERA
jgi:hypothetical protein